MHMPPPAAPDFGALNVTTIAQGVVAAILYFAVGVTVLIAGFLMVDLLTPGSLRRLVFIERRPNAVVLASAMPTGANAFLLARRFATMAEASASMRSSRRSPPERR